MDTGNATHAESIPESDRSELLAIARRSVERYLRTGAVPRETPGSTRLRLPGAAFVTLTDRGRLRGCIGYTEPVAPLYRVVQECAVAAATEDPRFPPVREEETGGLRFEISVLSSARPARPEEVQVGVHGLVVSRDGMRGLLLPQVAVEHGWDRETFLSQTCRKAGLPPDAWRRGASLRCFTAEIFGEK